MRYILIGNGKVANHFAFYLQQKNLPYSSWHYKDNITLELFLSKIKQQYNLSNNDLRVFILIKDSVIEEFYLNNPCLHNINYLFHCSGALYLKNIITLHPLMTFSNESYDLYTYDSLPFVTCSDDSNQLETTQYLPGLDNKIFTIEKDKLAYYHALCVCIGNFAQILWQKSSKEMSEKLGLPRDIVNLYIKNITKNYINNPETCLTGPLARGDHNTIAKNISALNANNSILVNTYNNFCDLYIKENNEQHA